MMIRVLTATIDNMVWISYRKPGEDWARAMFISLSLVSC